MPSPINPSSMFGFGFMMGAIMCYVYRREWEMNDWSLNTFLIMLIGIISFTLMNTLMAKLFPIKTSKVRISKINNYQLEDVIVWFILFYEILYYILYFWLVLGGVAISDLDVALLDARQDHQALPPIIQRMDLFSNVFTYYIEFLFAKNIALRLKNSYSRLIFLVCMVCILGSFLSGTKGYAIYQLLYIVFVWAIFKYKTNPTEHKVFSFKKIIKYSIWGFVGIWAFGTIADLQGRGSDLGPLYYFGVYSGGGIKNLDMFVNSPLSTSSFFGEYSLHLFDTKKAAFHQHQIINGFYPTGNLATAFQYYYQDFRLIGTGFFVAFIAIIMYFLYKKAILTKELERKTFSIWIFLFAYLGRGLALSFFSETFFLLFFSTYHLRTIVLIVLFAFLMENNFVNKVSSETLRRNKK